MEMGGKKTVSAEQAELLRQIPSVDELLAGQSEEHTSELQSRLHLVCRLLLEKKKNIIIPLARTRLYLPYTVYPVQPVAEPRLLWHVRCIVLIFTVPLCLSDLL